MSKPKSLKFSCFWNKLNAITVSHVNELRISLKAATRASMTCWHNGSSHGICILLSQLVALIHNYIFLISFNHLKIYVLIFILYITLFLESLFTCKHFKLRITPLFWQHLCYEQSSNVVIGLDFYRNALRHVSFDHKR
jgi:hypothetical protein